MLSGALKKRSDGVLGIVGERYRIAQNHKAFDFIDQLLGRGYARSVTPVGRGVNMPRPMRGQ